jgi:aspartyl-tRNA(Asn)/glutamyl-tRNA(Gln) amidotransferase subunit A
LVVNLHDLEAVDAVRLIRQRKVGVVEYVGALLQRIAETEPEIRAWAILDADLALREAAELERGRIENITPPLFGLAVGVKDIIDVAGYPTGAGFAPHAKRYPSTDSDVARSLRSAGALVLGKTITVQFAAGTTSPVTRNPWNAEATPGGSSSGSAAAVAARQVPVALGTQTGGSLIRPASFCGIVGLKPSSGSVSMRGIHPVSWSLDQPGVMARTVADAAMAWAAVTRQSQAATEFEKTTLGTGAWSIGVITELVTSAEHEVASFTEAALRRLEQAGGRLIEVPLPTSLQMLRALYTVIRGAEVAEVHAENVSLRAEAYESDIRASIEAAQLIPAWVAVRASRLRRRYRHTLDGLLAGVDVLICPSVSSPAPIHVEGTGSADFQLLSSLFGLPSITVPIGVGSRNLPHGLQIIGKPHADAQLIGAARWVETVVDFRTRPPLLP